METEEKEKRTNGSVEVLGDQGIVGTPELLGRDTGIQGFVFLDGMDGAKGLVITKKVNQGLSLWISPLPTPPWIIGKWGLLIKLINMP